jgi:hypothetical protein
MRRDGAPGYASEPSDCDDASASSHPGATELCNGLDDDCDGVADGADTDADSIHDACDDCRFTFNPAQSDQDDDGEGDACDTDDGAIFVFGPTNASRVEWQGETGESAWNVYHGDLSVLRSSGFYTQAPGSNPVAARQCGVAEMGIDDTGEVLQGLTRFTLVTGVTNGLEGGLGEDGQGSPRVNLNPCP